MNLWNRRTKICIWGIVFTLFDRLVKVSPLKHPWGNFVFLQCAEQCILRMRWKGNTRMRLKKKQATGKKIKKKSKSSIFKICLRLSGNMLRWTHWQRTHRHSLSAYKHWLRSNTAGIHRSATVEAETLRRHNHAAGKWEHFTYLYLSSVTSRFYHNVNLRVIWHQVIIVQQRFCIVLGGNAS